MQTRPKLNYPKTIGMGFGFMATCVAWAIYDPYVSRILEQKLAESAWVADWSVRLQSWRWLAKFIESQGKTAFAGERFTVAPLLMGIVMTFDNLFGVVFQPAFGRLSDGWRSRLGRRRPFVLVGAPLAALLFIGIPQAQSLGMLMLCLIAFVFIMSLWRAPVVAIMPDCTPSELHSEGNAVINFMGGIGGGIGMAAGTAVAAVLAWQRGAPVPESETYPYVFWLGGIAMVLGMLVLMLCVRERDSRKPRTEPPKQTAATPASHQSLRKRQGLGWLLASLFFLFCGSNAMQTFFTLFAKEVLGLKTAQATLLLLAFALCSMAAALPAGWCGKHWGRKRTMTIGLLLFLGAFLLFLLVLLWHMRTQNLSWSEGLAQWSRGQAMPQLQAALRVTIVPVLAIAGAGNMLIMVNALPLVLQIGGAHHVGTYTGYYYTATFSAQIASPIVYGVVRMCSGSYLSLFVYCSLAFLLSVFCIKLAKTPKEMRVTN